MAVTPSSHEFKPSTPALLTLEAWSQGFMVGALVIMAGITLANMRSGVLLHKLIMLEVSGTVYRSAYKPGCLPWPKARSGCTERFLRLLRSSGLGLVSLLHCCPAYCILDYAQHHRMDEEQAVP